MRPVRTDNAQFRKCDVAHFGLVYHIVMTQSLTRTGSLPASELEEQAGRYDLDHWSESRSMSIRSEH
jgi:hypothetical protein